MTILQAIVKRHSVRRFLDQPIHPAKAAQLSYIAEQCNRDYGVHIQPVFEDPQVFAGQKTFENCKNYIALVGPRGSAEALGYCGEMLVLKAQAIGLNTCWVAGTYRKRRVKAQLGKGERVYAVIALGCGAGSGKPHKIRKPEKLMQGPQVMPEWFYTGVEAASLAPTALGMQNFKFILRENGCVRLISRGFCKKLNKGILKYHFEAGAGAENFTWA